MPEQRTDHPPNVDSDRAFHDSWGTVSLFVAMQAGAAAFFYYVLRIGLADNDPLPVMKTLLLSYFILFLPQGCRIAMRGRALRDGRSWLSSPNFQSLLGLIAAVLCGLAAPYTGVDIAPLFCAGGLVLFVTTLGTWFRNASLKQSLLFITVSGLFSVWFGLAAYRGYHDPLFLESLVVGRTHLDELTVTAITNMIATHGIPSTGLDGVPYCPYHWGSFWIFAQLSKLLKLTAVESVHMGYPIVLVPLLINSLLVFAVELKDRFGYDSTDRLLRTDMLFWAVLFVALIGLPPKPLFFLVSLGLPASESFGVSLIICLVIFSLALSLKKIVVAAEPKPGAGETVLLLFVLPVLLCALTVTKLSTGFLVAVLYGYLFLRFRLYRSLRWVISLLMAALAMALAGAAVGIVSPTVLHSNFGLQESSIPFHPFHMVTAFLPSQWWPYFFVLHFVWSWLLLLGIARARGLGTVGDLRPAFRENRTVDLEIIVLMCLAGAAPGLLLAIAAGNAFYFSAVQSWVAVALILGNIEAFRPLLDVWGRIRGTQRASLKIIPLNSLFLGVVALSLAAGVLYEAVHTCGYAVYRNLSMRLCLVEHAIVKSHEEVGCGGKEWARNLGKRIRAAMSGSGDSSVAGIVARDVGRLFTHVQEGLDEAEHYPIVKVLQELGKLALAEKRRTLVFIPQSNKAYWNLIPPDFVLALDYPGCKAVPFISPAITGIASLDGMPIVGCDTYAFQYHVYRKRTREQTAADTGETTLCAKASAMGFSRIAIVNIDAHGTPQVRWLSCPTVLKR